MRILVRRAHEETHVQPVATVRSKYDKHYLVVHNHRQTWTHTVAELLPPGYRFAYGGELDYAHPLPEGISATVALGDGEQKLVRVRYAGRQYWHTTEFGFGDYYGFAIVRC